MANKFKMAVTCPVCGEIIVDDGWTVDFASPDGIVLLDLFECQEFECERCGTVVYTGDVDQMYEYEEGSEDESDDEDADDDDGR